MLGCGSVQEEDFLNQLDEKSLLLLWWEGMWADELNTDFQKHRTTNADINWIN